MGSPVLSLAMLIAFLPVVAIVHEAGHVVGGCLGRYYVAAVGLGGGRRFLHIPIGPRFNLFVGPVLLAGGATIAFPTHLPVRRRHAFSYHYGGIAAQLLFQAALHMVFWGIPSVRPLLLPGLALNALVVVANLLPYRIPVGGYRLASDGARALAAIGASVNLSPQAGLGAPAFRGVAARLGTDVAQFVLDVCRARVVNDDRSREFLLNATSPDGTPELYEAVFYFLRARLVRNDAQRHDELALGLATLTSLGMESLASELAEIPPQLVT